MKYAGFWKRFFAAFLDVLVLVIPAVAINWALPYIGSLVISILYYPIFESSRLRATPGKYWMGLKIQTVDGSALSFSRSLARLLLKYISAGFLLIGYLMQLLTEKRQTFHDLVVGAVVLDEANSEKPDWFGVWMKNLRSILQIEESVVAQAESTSPEMEENSRDKVIHAIEKLHELYKNGVLTEDEFLAKKSELLKQI